MLVQHALGPGINPQSFTIWAWWCTPVILESERLRQEDQEFKGLERSSNMPPAQHRICEHALPSV